MSKFLKYFQILFISVWAIIVIADYWIKHSIYPQIVSNFAYFDLQFILLVVAGIFSAVVLKFRDHQKVKKLFNGASLVILFLVLNAIALTLFNSKVPTASNFSLNGGGHLSIAGLLLKNGFIIFSIVGIAKGLGASINKLIGLKLRKPVLNIVEIALGLQGLVFLLFLLGSISMLRIEAVGILLLVLAGLHYKSVFVFFKTCLFDPIKLNKKLNVLGTMSFFFIGYLILQNFFQVNTPFPLGFDALNTYGPLPKLIAEHQEIIGGYQIYNWSLFMSLGYILLDSSEIAMGLSMLGGVLTLFALYALGKYYLKMNVNILLFALLVFYVTPSICVQSYLEVKIDLGLLFVLVTTVILLTEWVTRIGRSFDYPNEQKEPEPLVEKKGKILVANANEHLVQLGHQKLNLEAGKKYAEIVAIGLLLGFAFGIKLTTLFAVFCTIMIYWYVYSGSLAALGVALISIASVLIVKLDQMTGLRDYHLSVDIVQWVVLAIGIGLVGYSVLQNKDKAMKAVWVSAITIGLFGASVTPWIAKNFLDTKCLSQKCLLQGKKKGNSIPVQKILKKYKKYDQSGK